MKTRYFILYKQTNKMHFLCIFILRFLSNSTCFERPFRSSSGVNDLLYLQLCTNHANVSNCSVLRLDLFVYRTGYDAWYIQYQNHSYMLRSLFYSLMMGQVGPNHVGVNGFFNTRVGILILATLL